MPEVVTIVGATDYTAFQEFLGISCIDMYFDGPYGVYHSMYDNYFRQSTVVDQGFKIGTSLVTALGVLAWQLADAQVLPMRYSDYARAAVGYIEAAERHAGSETPLRLAGGARGGCALGSGCNRVRAPARRWNRSTPDAARAVNDRLMAVERALVEPAGQRGRPFIRHLLVAPQPSYRSAYLPRIWDALDRAIAPRSRVTRQRSSPPSTGPRPSCARPRRLVSDGR